MRGNALQIAIVDAAKLPKGLLDAKKAEDPTADDSFTWGEVVGGYKVYACHAAQLDILASKAKFTFAFAGSGAGKTCLIPLWLMKRIQENPKGRFLVVSPNTSTFEGSQLKQHILDTSEGTALQGSWQDSKKIYRLPTGGEIIVRTLGDGTEADRIRGGQYDGAVIDEGVIVSAAVWEEVRRRVSNKDGRILVVTTPDSNGWIYEAKSEYEKGNKDYFVRHWSKLNNPAVSKEDVERERATLPEWKFKRMVDGQFSALEGLCFDVFSDPKSPEYPIVQVKGNPIDALPSPPICFFGGNDWGYRPDPAAVLMIAECEDGCAYVVEEIYGTEIPPDVLAVKVKQMIDRWAVRVDGKYADFLRSGRFVGFFTDTSRPEHTASFRRANIPIRNKVVDDILAGVTSTASWFKAGRLKVFSTCKNLIREATNYQWDIERGGGYKDKPRGKDDHAVDALRYAISSRKYKETITPVVASSLTQDAIDKLEEEKLVRLGLVADPQADLEELEQQKRNERFYLMAWGDLL